MSHDLEDLLEIIKQLEFRVIALEAVLKTKNTLAHVQANDSYYWEHG